LGFCGEEEVEMKKRDIFITEFDLERLNKLIEDEKSSGGGNKAYLGDLEEELGRATVVDSKDIPEDVITMNSTVRLKDLETGEDMTLSLVFPQDADIDEGRISILAPIGTGMIGYGVGEVIEWQVPAGTRSLEVEEILYQPEAAGDFHL
jgi:regulator of nucleoside diphosphate kinase